MSEQKDLNLDLNGNIIIWDGLRKIEIPPEKTKLITKISKNSLRKAILEGKIQTIDIPAENGGKKVEDREGVEK